MGEKKLKILCLHGYGYSGAYLKKRLQVWPSYILEKMDCVYIDAPFPTHDKPFPAYSWFESSAEDEDTFDRTFNESMAFIEETMVKYGPFDGVLGFSQGAYIAAALPGIQSQGVAFTKVEPIKFVMVISGGKLGGFRVPAPKVAENAFNSPIAIPSLHCFGENDLAKLTAIELLKSFVDPFVIYHSGGHEVPKLDDKGLKAMLSFFDKIQAIVPVQRIRSTDTQEENMNNMVEKKFKVLCIHGYKNSGAYLKKQLQVWPANVLEKMDFVFIDALFPVHDKPFPAFSWFHASTEDAGKYNSQFNESIAYIEETMVEYGPFDGVIGFSQGAYIAAALPGMQAQGVALTNVEDIKFVMVISGGKLGGLKYPAPKLAENAFSSPIEIPSLHYYGENDFAKLTAIELLGSFVDPFVIYHSGGHVVPKLDDEGLKVMLSFLDKIQAVLPPQRIRSLM